MQVKALRTVAQVLLGFQKGFSGQISAKHTNHGKTLRNDQKFS
jgi:hypothetical protein